MESGAGELQGGMNEHKVVELFYSIKDTSAPLSGHTATKQGEDDLPDTAFVIKCLQNNTR